VSTVSYSARELSAHKCSVFSGVHLQDILSISDGNPSKRQSDGAVHWRKFALMDEAVTAVIRCQQHARSYPCNTAVEKLIMDVPVMDEDVSASTAGYLVVSC
jgi:hypothetical protein